MYLNQKIKTSKSSIGYIQYKYFHFSPREAACNRASLRANNLTEEDNLS